MRRTLLSERESIDEPRPQFASAEDIALAERLLRELEVRYLGGSAQPARTPSQSCKLR